MQGLLRILIQREGYRTPPAIPWNKRKQHPLFVSSTDKEADTINTEQHSLVKMVRGKWGEERFANKLQYELEAGFFPGESWLYPDCCCSISIPTAAADLAGYNQVFNKLLPAGNNSVCEKAPRALPPRYGRRHSHRPPWRRCSLPQSWKTPGSGEEKQAFAIHAHVWDKL